MGNKNLELTLSTIKSDKRALALAYVYLHIFTHGV